MVAGVGTDILSMARFCHALRCGGEAFLSYVYTPEELALAQGRPVSLASHFSGKEAVFKALDTVWQPGMTMRDIEITVGANGAPRVRLHGKAAQIAAEKGIGTILLSLSQEDEYAIAVAAVRTEQEEPP